MERTVESRITKAQLIRSAPLGNVYPKLHTTWLRCLQRAHSIALPKREWVDDYI
jgi:hypothetical protein